ncbi:hypothetical protein HQN89_02695 [Paenibacillus frigoriresistens]|nr:hypothetical protein [Paenibacillus frigoriresistens]
MGRGLVIGGSGFRVPGSMLGARVRGLGFGVWGSGSELLAVGLAYPSLGLDSRLD